MKEPTVLFRNNRLYFSKEFVYSFETKLGNRLDINFIKKHNQIELRFHDEGGHEINWSGAQTKAYPAMLIARGLPMKQNQVVPVWDFIDLDDPMIILDLDATPMSSHDHQTFRVSIGGARTIRIKGPRALWEAIKVIAEREKETGSELMTRIAREYIQDYYPEIYWRIKD